MADVYVLASPSPTLYAYPSSVHVGSGAGLFGTVSMLSLPPLDPKPERRQPRPAPPLAARSRAIPDTTHASPTTPTNDDRSRRRRDEEALLTLGAI